ncbi:MAG: ATP-binding protein [Nanoarchaeota archaeon]|nr:ATP-binding protein [Nanoarchaeota archaeon]MBU1321710.1 ATP-binding protein [Nanoarchaeota archaeon]MBU1597676.1 ATP-binding protein [Nanoarchaeota archaeon]MBU2441024.1 ATP-binding protein [Nanoarchaeota archaeon]
MVTKSDFVLEWDKALGFRGDPFADKIFLPINKFLVNRKDEKEKMNWFFIKNYFYGAIVGEDGVGKTTMMRWLEDRLGKYNRIHSIYINAAIFKDQINILQKMLEPLLSFYEKTFSKPHKKLLSADFLGFLKKKLGQKSVALLIDNAHHITDKNLELIKNLRKEGLKLQIIVSSTQKEYEKSRLREIGSDELSITLRRLTFDEAKEMLQKRIEAFGGKGIYPFTEDSIKKMHDKADKNPREFLKLCRDEAIKILIHKREILEQNAVVAKESGIMHKEAKPLKTSGKKKHVSEEKMDVKIRTATEKESEEEKNKEKHGFFRIKFAPDEDDNKPKAKPVHKHNDDRRAIHDDKHKQHLLNQLKSTSPRRKDKEETSKAEPLSAKDKSLSKSRDDDHISDTDKLLKELAEEFEVD